MTLERIAYLAEVFGSVLIVVTLILLVVQVRRNTQSLRSVAAQGAHEQWANIYDSFRDPSFSEVFIRAARDPSTLSPVDSVRIHAFWMQAHLNAQNWFLQTKERAMDRVLLDSYAKVLPELTHSAMWKQFWERRRFIFAPEYVAFVERIRDASMSQGPYLPIGVSLEKVADRGQPQGSAHDAQQPVAADGQA